MVKAEEGQWEEGEEQEEEGEDQEEMGNGDRRGTLTDLL